MFLPKWQTWLYCVSCIRLSSQVNVIVGLGWHCSALGNTYVVLDSSFSVFFCVNQLPCGNSHKQYCLSLELLCSCLKTLSFCCHMQGVWKVLNSVFSCYVPQESHITQPVLRVWCVGSRWMVYHSQWMLPTKYTV